MPSTISTHSTEEKRGSLTIHQTLLAAGACCLAVFAGCGKEAPQYYEVQDVQPEPAAEQAEHVHTEDGTHVHTEAAANPLGFNFAVPEGWNQKVASSMVILALQAGNPPELVADVSVSAFPGDVGGQLANIDRWRRQVGLGPLDPAALAGFIKAVQISGLEGWQVDMTGPAGLASDGSAVRMIVSAVSNNGQTWFFKMVGPENAVAGQAGSYAAFIESIRF
ncbi:MAG TPA: hypothetical protein VK995_02170 [Oceanipulchritudo sp.]|nr:hypothetical protein [Oceanipulchritudo sp.]